MRPHPPQTTVVATTSLELELTIPANATSSSTWTGWQTTFDFGPEVGISGSTEISYYSDGDVLFYATVTNAGPACRNYAIVCGLADTQDRIYTMTDCQRGGVSGSCCRRCAQRKGDER